MEHHQIVPTPVGNMEDMTMRAIRILKEADLVLSNIERPAEAFLISKCFSRTLDVRVSSASTKSASFSMRMARIVMSSMLPTGVGTMYNVPILTANVVN